MCIRCPLQNQLKFGILARPSHRVFHLVRGRFKTQPPVAGSYGRFLLFEVLKRPLIQWYSVKYCVIGRCAGIRNLYSSESHQLESGVCLVRDVWLKLQRFMPDAYKGRDSGCSFDIIPWCMFLKRAYAVIRSKGPKTTRSLPVEFSSTRKRLFTKLLAPISVSYMNSTWSDPNI